MTKSQIIATDVASLLQARSPLLWVVTREEARVEGYLMEASAAAQYVPHTWDIAQGAVSVDGNPDTSLGDTKDIDAMLEVIRNRTKGSERDVWILRDLPAWITGQVGVVTLRKLRNLVRLLPGVETKGAQSLIVISPSKDIPPELTDHTTVIEWPLPDKEEIGDIMDVAIEAGGTKVEVPTNGVRDAAIGAAVGLSGEEAASCYAKSLVSLKKVDPLLVAQEKKRLIAREGVLEWYDPLPGGLDSVGGLSNVKDWLLARKAAYSPKAREYGLPPPKGALLVGVPGNGKSLTAKAIATAWAVPLLRVDLGGLKSKFVGESEGNLRKALRVIEAIGRCVVWFDEIEKALQGSTSGSADGGVSSDALGTILSWMQERQGEAFVIATANDVSGLPPELLRKGRFDEVWWVDLPTQEERVAILAATLRTHGRGKVKIDLEKVAANCRDFTGAEIAALVPDAMFSAFNDRGREITTQDLLKSATTVTPLAKTMAEKIDSLRNWAKGRARRASPEETAPKLARVGRALDL